jgi:hypothetical protein
MHGADDMPTRCGGGFQGIICVGSTDHEMTVDKQRCAVYSACCIAMAWMNLTLWMRSRFLLQVLQSDRRQWARRRSPVRTRERKIFFLEGRIARRHSIPREEAPAGASRHGHRSSYRFVVASVSCYWPCADRGRMGHQDPSPISGAFGQFQQSWVFSHDDSVSCIVMRMHPAERQLKCKSVRGCRVGRITVIWSRFQGEEVWNVNYPVLTPVQNRDGSVQSNPWGLKT